MTQDEIIEMARQAGLSNPLWIENDYAIIEAFAKLVAAKAFPDGVDAEWVARRTKYAVEQEREACAKVCDDLDAHRQVATWYSQAIRARGEPTSRGEA